MFSIVVALARASYNVLLEAFALRGGKLAGLYPPTLVLLCMTSTASAQLQIA